MLAHAVALHKVRGGWRDENNLKFEEKSINEFRYPNLKKYSILEVKHSHSIRICNGCQEQFLNQLLEHIKKYNPKIE